MKKYIDFGFFGGFFVGRHKRKNHYIGEGEPRNIIQNVDGFVAAQKFGTHFVALDYFGQSASTSRSLSSSDWRIP
jgi:hypothetical protein